MRFHKSNVEMDELVPTSMEESIKEAIFISISPQ